MSIRLMSLVWTNFPRGGSEKLVLLALADWANDEGGSLHPSIGAIAKKACLKECQARRLVRKFETQGLLEIVGNREGGAPGTTRHYRLNVAKLQTAVLESTPIAGETPVRKDREGSPAGSSRAVVDESQTISRTIKNRQGEAPRSPACPYQELVAAYHEELPAHPRCVALNEARKSHMRARWDFWKAQGKYDTHEKGLQWWRRMFKWIDESDFLAGRVAPTRGRPQFIADVDFIFAPESNLRIVEGKYHDAVMAAA